MKRLAGFFWAKYLTPNGRKTLMDMLQGFGPSNPRPWNTGHPSLRNPRAPHESRATMRMHRAGWSGFDICDILKIRPGQLQFSIRKAMDEESLAHRAGLPILGDTVPRGTK